MLSRGPVLMERRSYFCCLSLEGCSCVTKSVVGGRNSGTVTWRLIQILRGLAGSQFRDWYGTVGARTSPSYAKRGLVVAPQNPGVWHRETKHFPRAFTGLNVLCSQHQQPFVGCFLQQTQLVAQVFRSLLQQ